MRKKAAIIGGASPHFFCLPQELLREYPVIGVNDWPLRGLPCDYWVVLDTGRAFEIYGEPAIRDVQTEKYWRKPNETEQFVPEDLANWFVDAPRDSLDRQYQGRLRWESSSALAAMNLAVTLGFERILLFGVDFVGTGRLEDLSKTYPNWENHRDNINLLVKQIQDLGVEVFKMHRGSWIDCPLWPESPYCRCPGGSPPQRAE